MCHGLGSSSAGIEIAAAASEVPGWPASEWERTPGEVEEALAKVPDGGSLG